VTTANVIQGHTFLVAFSKQSAAGTPATTYEFIVPIYGGLPKPAQDVQDFEVADGDPFRPGRYKQRGWAAGQIEFAAFPDSAARLINAHLGADAKTGSSDPWTHVLTRNVPQWMTFWVRRTLPDGSFKWDRYDDALVKSVEISSGNGDMLRCTSEILAVNATTDVSAPSAASSPFGVTNVLDSTGPWYTWLGGTLKLDVSATPATTQVHNLENWTFHMGYDDAELVWTDQLVASFRDLGQWKVGLSGDFILQDYSFLNAVYYGSASPSANTAIQQSIPQGSADFTIAVGPTANADRTLRIQAPALNFDSEYPDVDVSGKGLRASLTASLTKPASGEPVTVTMKNAISSDLDA
jgi:hypothetical protein